MNVPFNRSTRRALALMTVAALIAAGCGRDEDTDAADDDDGETSEVDGEVAGAGGRLDDGEFGDLGVICQDGDASGESDVGVTDDEIVVGTITDKGSDVRAGLTREMYDTAVAFTEWCNAHGGINGRELVLQDMDAALFEYADRIAEGCEDTFALVGGGAVFDANDEGQRQECGLANVAGYVVTPDARAATEQVQPLPNPVTEYPVQHINRFQEIDPEINRYGLLWVNLPGPLTVAEQARDSAITQGYEIAFDQEVAAQGETGWANFVRQMRDQDVQVVEYIGEPEDMARLLEAMQVEGWYPEYVLGQPNMYDELLVAEAGSSLGEGVVVRTSFPPFDINGDVPAVGDYRDLMANYNDDGKWPAALGMQGLSAWLLFAQAATECGDDLTRECLLDNAHAVEDWTAGGLHGTTNPGNLEAGRCAVMLRVTEDGIVYDEELTNPDDGIFNCEETNVLALEDDYGVEAPAR